MNADNGYGQFIDIELPYENIKSHMCNNKQANITIFKFTKSNYNIILYILFTILNKIKTILKLY